jgi:hypothetical protein
VQNPDVDPNARQKVPKNSQSARVRNAVTPIWEGNDINHFLGGRSPGVMSVVACQMLSPDITSGVETLFVGVGRECSMLKSSTGQSLLMVLNVIQVVGLDPERSLNDKT